MIKIGTTNDPAGQWQARFTASELARVGVESAIVSIEHQGESPLSAALLRGDIDVAVYALNELPVEQAEGLVITALSQRDNPADCLVIRPSAVDTQQIFRLKQGVVAGVFTEHRKVQLQDFRPDIVLKAPWDTALLPLEQLRQGHCEAIFLEAVAMHRLEMEVSDWEVIELYPGEWIPAPGQGVLAWQTHRDDLATRRVFRQLHHPEVAACTNVERRILQLLSADERPALGAYCHRDAAGNYHVVASCRRAGALHRARLSSSTNSGLGERVAGMLR